MKWQQIAGYGSLGVIALIIGLLNLTGVSYSHDGDKFCTECYSEIKVNSTYWEVKVEHAGDKDVVFKKLARSRTLWVNLDKIEGFLITEPRIKTEILVPATSSTASLNHPEYGYLRPLKDGDTLISRGSDRFVVYGSKPIELTVKWSLILDDNLIEAIKIDPIWSGINITVIQGNCITGRTNREIIIYTNRTFCSDEPINNSCIKIANGSHKSQILMNRTVCEDIGFQIGSRKIIYKNSGFNCKKEGCFINCDSCSDGNCNGIITSGESYITFDTCSNLEKSSQIDSKGVRELEIE